MGDLNVPERRMSLVEARKLKIQAYFCMDVGVSLEIIDLKTQIRMKNSIFFKNSFVHFF